MYFHINGNDQKCSFQIRIAFTTMTTISNIFNVFSAIRSGHTTSVQELNVIIRVFINEPSWHVEAYQPLPFGNFDTFQPFRGLKSMPDQSKKKDSIIVKVSNKTFSSKRTFIDEARKKRDHFISLEAYYRSCIDYLIVKRSRSDFYWISATIKYNMSRMSNLRLLYYSIYIQVPEAKKEKKRDYYWNFKTLQIDSMIYLLNEMMVW